MSIASMIREKLELRRAKAAGIDPKKYVEYQKERKKQLFLKEQTANRQAEEKLIQEKARLKTEAKLKGYRETAKAGGRLKMFAKELNKLRKEKQKQNKNLFSLGGSKPGGVMNFKSRRVF